MNNIKVIQSPRFKKAFKKLHLHMQKIVYKAIRAIILSPEIGIHKAGDLLDVYIYKFKINKQEHLLAYEWDEKTRILLALGVHENFYRDLKR